MDDQIPQQDSVLEAQDGELMEDAPVTEAAKEGDAIVLMNLESLIKSHVATIDKLGRDAREQKETLENILNNDATYREHSEKAKDAAKVKAETRSQITKRTDVKMVVEKLKELKTEAGEMQEELNEYLREYQRMSGNTEIEGDNGEMLKIVTVAHLVKSSSGR